MEAERVFAVLSSLMALCTAALCLVFALCWTSETVRSYSNTRSLVMAGQALYPTTLLLLAMLSTGNNAGLCLSFPFNHKTIFFKYNLLINNRVTSTLDSDAAPTAGQGLGLYKFISAMPYIGPRRCTDSVVHLNTSHWIILKHSFQSRKTKLCWFNI